MLGKNSSSQECPQIQIEIVSTPCMAREPSLGASAAEDVFSECTWAFTER
jgi:hypothetical protein